MEVVNEAELHPLSVSECRSLLSSTNWGRLAVTYRALPAVVPVRIHLVNDELTIASLLGAAIPLVSGTVVALEAGTLGDGLPNEWTVEIYGILRGDSPLAGAPKVSDETFRLSTDTAHGWATHGPEVVGNRSSTLV